MNSMKHYTLILATLLSLLLPVQSWGLTDINQEEYLPMLDEMYRAGQYEVAFTTYKKVAEKFENDKAQFMVGLMYLEGKHVSKDYKEALKWLTLSAKQENRNAYYNLGRMYYSGLGVIQDFKTSFKWFTLAVEQGMVMAQYNLGAMYLLAQGVPQDVIKAHMWFNISASNGDSGAEERDRLAAEQMTPSQIENAHDLARECVAKNYKGC